MYSTTLVAIRVVGSLLWNLSEKIRLLTSKSKTITTLHSLQMDQVYPENSFSLTQNSDMIDNQPLLQPPPAFPQRRRVLAKAKECAEAFQDKFKPGSMASSVFTLIMATFGTGILVLPASIAESGLIWAIIQLVFCAWLGYYSLMTVVICAIKSKVCSYQELAEKTYGKRRRMRKIVRRTMIAILLCSTFVGVFGYITFANNLNIFSNPEVGGVVLYAYAYDANEQFTSPPAPVRICLIMMCLALIVATPINVIPAKDAIKEIFFPKKCDKFGEPYDENDSFLSHFLFVTSTLICAAVLAIFPQASIQNLMNATASSLYTLICFIFPTVFYLKLYEDKPINKRKMLNWTILVVMTGVGIWMTEANVAFLVSDE